MQGRRVRRGVVLVDARWLAGNRSGLGMFTTELVRRWVAADHPMTLLVAAGTGGAVDEVVPGAPVLELAAPFHLRAAALARRCHARYFSPDSLIVPALLGRSATVCVHDLAPILHPATHHRRVRTAYRLLLRLAAHRSGSVVTPSEATRRDLLRHSPQARVTVVPEGARDLPAGGRLPDGVRPPYVLFTGTLEPRKHPVELVEAFTAVAPDQWRLVLAGGLGWLGDDDRRRLDAAANHPRVHRLGYVADDVLGALLHGADLLAYPSSYEGFGLPVLEAMAAGVPVLTTNAAAIVEVTRGAALTVDLAGPDPFGTGLREAMSAALGDAALRARLAAAGRERAGHFSWDTAADEVWRAVTAPL